MITDDDIVEAVQEARGDKPMAFVRLERKLRETVHQKLKSLDEQQNYEAWNAYYIGYMNHTIAIARGLGIDVFNSWDIPSHARGSSLSDTYNDFTAAVDSYSIQIRLANAEHLVLYTVYLSAEEKRKIRHFGSQIKDVIDKSTLTLEKRDELFALLDSFLKEVDRDRTRLEVVGAFVTGVAHIIGDAAKELEPVRSLVDSIAKIFGKAQESQPKSFPRPDTKQIQLPRSEPTTKAPASDDDIPF